MIVIAIAIVMTSCEPELDCNCTKSVYLMESWECNLFNSDCDIFRIEFEQNVCPGALYGIQASDVIKYKLNCPSGYIVKQ